MEEPETVGGPLEGSARVLRELLRTPNFKKTVRILLRELDPPGAAALVRVLMWEDPEFFLGLAGALPRAANAGIQGVRELLRQASAFPPPLLAAFLAEAASQVDGEALGEAAGLLVGLASSVSGQEDSRLAREAREVRKGFGRGLARALGEEEGGGGAAALKAALPALSGAASRVGEEAVREGSETSRLVEELARGMEQIARGNPEFMRGVVAPLVGAWRSSVGRHIEETEGEEQGGE